ALFAADDRVVVPATESQRVVPLVEMQRVYEEVKTPVKYGIVLRPGENESIDCPNVFRFGDKWYMVYIAIKGKVGYETYLAESKNLLQWKTLGKILPFADSGWDRWQAAGGVALANTAWGGTGELQRYDGKYWMSYIGGAKQGYETDPLSMGMAWTKTPDRPIPWTRCAGNPILAPEQPD